MAAALIHNPPVLFLDEPTSGVDVLTRRDFWNHITSLAKKGVTIMVTTHFMDEAEYCDRISLFYHGETIAVGTPKELKQKAGANDMETAFINLIKESEVNK
jgi:ABC-type multidrug transport system ATPase subunit